MCSLERAVGRQLDVAKGLELLVADKQRKWKEEEEAAASLPAAMAELAAIRRKVAVAKADVAKL